MDYRRLEEIIARGKENGYSAQSGQPLMKHLVVEITPSKAAVSMVKTCAGVGVA